MLYAALGFIGNLHLIWPPFLAHDDITRNGPMNKSNSPSVLCFMVQFYSKHKFTFVEMDKETKMQVSHEVFLASTLKVAFH